MDHYSTKAQVKFFIQASPVELETEFNAWSRNDVLVQHMSFEFNSALQKFILTIIYVDVNDGSKDGYSDEHKNKNEEHSASRSARKEQKKYKPNSGDSGSDSVDSPDLSERGED